MAITFNNLTKEQQLFFDSIGINETNIPESFYNEIASYEQDFTKKEQDYILRDSNFDGSKSSFFV